MTVRYGPIAAWLARMTADALLRGHYQTNTVSDGIFASPDAIAAGGATITQLRRQSVVRGDNSPTNRPLVLDWMYKPDGGESLDGIGLSKAAVEWLVEQRYVPRLFVPALHHDDWEESLIDTPDFIFWRDHLYIPPPPVCPVQGPSTSRGSVFDKVKTYTQAERVEAHREIDARSDLDARSKAAHKAHVTRRTVKP